MPQVGLLVDVTASHGMRIVRGVREFLMGHAEWSVALRGVAPVALPSQIREVEADGMVASLVDAAQVQVVQDGRRPVVNVSARLRTPGVPQVIPDDVAIGRLVAEHFLTRGYRRLAYLGIPGHVYSEDRLRGFADRAREEGVAVDAVDLGSLRGAAESDRLRKWLSTLPLPVGLMACNDIRARSAVNLAMGEGLRVPDDLAVVGVDNDPLQGELSALPLSSVDVAWERIGYEAMETLALRMAGGSPPDRRIPPRMLVERRSSDAYAVADGLVARAMQYMREHASEAISVEDVLGELDVSRRSLELRFARAVGHTPYAHLLQLRVEAAKRLLAGSSMPLHKVAAAAGFGDARQFSTTFRRHTGVTPGAYRKRINLG